MTGWFALEAAMRAEMVHRSAVVAEELTESMLRPALAAAGLSEVEAAGFSLAWEWSEVE